MKKFLFLSALIAFSSLFSAGFSGMHDSSFYRDLGEFGTDRYEKDQEKEEQKKKEEKSSDQQESNAPQNSPSERVHQ